MIRNVQPRHVQVKILVSLVAFVFAALGIWRLFVHTQTGQQLEAWALDFATPWHGARWHDLTGQFEIITPLVSAGLAGAIIIFLLREKTWQLWVQAVTVTVAANLTTQLLKAVVLERPRLIDIAPFHNSLPSGHTTAAASLMVVLMLVVARRSSAWVGVLGGFFTAAVGIYTLWGQWHRGSDVLVAILVVSFWASLALLVFPAPVGGDGAGTKTVGPKSSRSGVLMWLFIYALALTLLSAAGYALAAVVPQGQVAIAFFASVCATIGMSVSCFSWLTQLHLAQGQRQQK